jgi:hypothetical protein
MDTNIQTFNDLLNKLNNLVKNRDLTALTEQINASMNHTNQLLSQLPPNYLTIKEHKLLCQLRNSPSSNRDQLQLLEEKYEKNKGIKKVLLAFEFDRICSKEDYLELKKMLEDYFKDKSYVVSVQCFNTNFDPTYDNEIYCENYDDYFYINCVTNVFFNESDVEKWKNKFQLSCRFFDRWEQITTSKKKCSDRHHKILIRNEESPSYKKYFDGEKNYKIFIALTEYSSRNDISIIIEAVVDVLAQ